MRIDIKVAELIGAFISIVFGLALTSTVSSYSVAIVNDSNSSELMKTFAPFIPFFWIIACMGIAAALVYKYFKG